MITFIRSVFGAVRPARAYCEIQNDSTMVFVTTCSNRGKLSGVAQLRATLLKPFTANRVKRTMVEPTAWTIFLCGVGLPRAPVIPSRRPTTRIVSIPMTVRDFPVVERSSSRCPRNELTAPPQDLSLSHQTEFFPTANLQWP